MIISDIQYLYNIYKHKEYKFISERMMEVEREIVRKVVKKGRTILTCSCQNHRRFPNESLCRHKSFFMLFPLFEYYDKKIKNLIDYINSNKKLSEKYRLNVNEIIIELEDLRKVK